MGDLKRRTAKTTAVKLATAEHVLVLKSVSADMTSYNGFKWSKSGTVSAPDFKATRECGAGLHGFLWGEGDGSLANWEHDAKWLVLKVDKATIIDLNGKVKFPACEVVFCGDRIKATEYLRANGGEGKCIIGGTATAGYGGTATAGYGGTATAGTRGTATAGDGGTATAGTRGTATAGDGGTATAGYGGTATAGDGGTATAGTRGTATAGDGGTLNFHWYDYDRNKWRVRSFEVGEGDVKPNVKYQYRDNALVEVKL